MVGVAEEHPLGEMSIHVGGLGFRLFDPLALFRRPFLPEGRGAERKRRGQEYCSHVHVLSSIY